MSPSASYTETPVLSAYIESLASPDVLAGCAEYMIGGLQGQMPDADFDTRRDQTRQELVGGRQFAATALNGQPD
jgi:hypothetical protein